MISLLCFAMYMFRTNEYFRLYAYGPDRKGRFTQDAGVQRRAAYSSQSKYEKYAHILFRSGISNKILYHRLFYVLIVRKKLHLNVGTSELYENIKCP